MRKHAIAKRLADSARINPCVLTLQALAETYNAIVKKLPNQKDDAARSLSALALTIPVIAAEPSDFEEAMTAHRSRPVHFWDAMLWATAKRAGCKLIVTENLPDRPSVEGVLYLDPFAPKNQNILASFIR